MYDCIIPWSGGVESTALVCDCLRRGMNPYCFHLTLNGKWIKQIEAVKKMSEVLGVKLSIVDYKNNDTYLEPSKTTEHYGKMWSNSLPPMFFYWTNVAHIIQLNNPQINRIYYGYNGGIISRDDGMGDKHTDWVDKHFRHIEDVCAMLGVETKMSAPLGDMAKVEQWELIFDSVKDHVHTCVDLTQKECGFCDKCKEMEYMKSSL
jgi:7-cyano-7-deazaguanine synthase in queuosine biosynthesis